MSNFNVDDFINQLEQDKVVSNTGDRLQKIRMNAPDNQGSMTFLPFTNKKTGKFYLKVPRVREFNARSSKLDKEAWFMIMPKEMYGELSKEDSELYDSVVGLFDALDKSDRFSYEVLRVRDYSLMFGIPISHTNTKKTEITEFLGKPSLLIFPSARVINSMAAAISNKVSALKGNQEWLTGIFNDNPTGRVGVVSISFVKATGAGYDIGVTFELNAPFANVVDPTLEIPETAIAKFDDAFGELLSWMKPENGYFDTAIFTELRDTLVREYNRVKASQVAAATPSVQVQNSNSGTDPMLQQAPPAPPVVAQPPQLDPITGMPVIPGAPTTAKTVAVEIDPLTGLPKQ